MPLVNVSTARVWAAEFQNTDFLGASEIVAETQARVAHELAPPEQEQQQ